MTFQAAVEPPHETEQGAACVRQALDQVGEAIELGAPSRILGYYATRAAQAMLATGSIRLRLPQVGHVTARD